jgi:hypothetical protein
MLISEEEAQLFIVHLEQPLGLQCGSLGHLEYSRSVITSFSYHLTRSELTLYMHGTVVNPSNERSCLCRRGYRLPNLSLSLVPSPFDHDEGCPCLRLISSWVVATAAKESGWLCKMNVRLSELGERN